MNQDTLWKTLCDEARQFARDEPALAPYLRETILDQASFADALAMQLARLLDSRVLPAAQLRDTIRKAQADDSALVDAAVRDVLACRERDAACTHHLLPLLYFKGFQALQSYRIAHHLYGRGRHALAFYLQSRMAQVFDVDIHPAAAIGTGILVDHATGVVIGETAVVEDNVSMLHGVTLGGSGLGQGCDRHPKIRRGVLLSTGAKVLGCVEVGEGAKVAAGSVVLDNVPAHTTVAGIPAKVVGRPAVAEPALSMNHELNHDR